MPDLDLDRLAQVAAHHVRDARRDGGREEDRLALLGNRPEDLLEVLGEAHVEHLVGLVEDEDGDAVQAEGLARQVIDGAAGRGDDDVRAALQRVQLPRDRLPAVDGQDAGAEIAPVAVDRLRDLDGELTCRHQDEGPRIAAHAEVRQPLQQGQRERRRLPGPRGGLTQQIPPCEQRRDGLALDGRGLLVPQIGQRGGELGHHAEVAEAPRVVRCAAGVFTRHASPSFGDRGRCIQSATMLREAPRKTTPATGACAPFEQAGSECSGRRLVGVLL